MYLKATCIQQEPFSLLARLIVDIIQLKYLLGMYEHMERVEEYEKYRRIGT